MRREKAGERGSRALRPAVAFLTLSTVEKPEAVSLTLSAMGTPGAVFRMPSGTPEQGKFRTRAATEVTVRCRRRKNSRSLQRV
jgi:hypothetical protein